jgi:DNA-binding transcriptional ArsR family regulator
MSNTALIEDEKNIDFVQVYTDTFKSFGDLTKKSPISAQILFFFIQNMAVQNNALSVSLTALSEILGYSKPTLIKAIKVLESDKYIEVIKQGTSNIYVINEKVAWRKARNQRQYAIFSATVVATSSENQKAIDELNSGRTRKLRNVPRFHIEKPELPEPQGEN